MPKDPDLHIITVHGTWARGFFPEPPSPDAAPAPWCTPESSFMTGIRQALEERGVGHSISHFQWSGANSVLERDHAARALAESLGKALMSRPDAHHAIIAHSHGGNIALRGIHLLREKAGEPANLTGRMSLVTIATPFLQITRSKISFTKFIVFINMVLLIILGGALLMDEVSSAGGIRSGLDGFHFPIVPAIALGLVVVHLSAEGLAGHIGRPVITPDQLESATYYPSYDGSFRLLVLRGVEDEASMALMFSSISNRLMDVATAVGAYAVSAVALLFLLGAVLAGLGIRLGPLGAGTSDDWLAWFLLYLSAWVYLAMATAGFLRAVYGRELFGVAFGSSVSVQSVPDMTGPAIVATLPRRDQRDLSVLHSLYDHPACSSEVIAWLKHGQKVRALRKRG